MQDANPDLPKLKTFTLQRTYHDEATIGILSDDLGVEICKILERPRYFNGEENKRDDSKTPVNESCCIPEGTYHCALTYSSRFKKYMFEILGVNSRSGIRIHCANWVTELHGCLATASRIEENSSLVGKPTRFKAVSSTAAMAKFREIAPKKFILLIKS